MTPYRTGQIAALAHLKLADERTPEERDADFWATILGGAPIPLSSTIHALSTAPPGYKGRYYLREAGGSTLGALLGGAAGRVISPAASALGGIVGGAYGARRGHQSAREATKRDMARAED